GHPDSWGGVVPAAASPFTEAIPVANACALTTYKCPLRPKPCRRAVGVFPAAIKAVSGGLVAKAEPWPPYTAPPLPLRQQYRGTHGLPGRQRALRFGGVGQGVALADIHLDLAAGDHGEQLVGHGLQALGGIG